jgi:hypothetical protein
VCASTSGDAMHYVTGSACYACTTSILYTTIPHPNGDGDVCTMDSTCSAGAHARKEGRKDERRSSLCSIPTTNGMGMHT